MNFNILREELLKRKRFSLIESFYKNHRGSHEKWIDAYRAIESRRGIMTDSIKGAIYFFPTKELAELWAGDIGKVIKRKIRVDTASIQAVTEGNIERSDPNLVWYTKDGKKIIGKDFDVVIRVDIHDKNEVLEIVVFNKDFIK